MKQYLIFPIVLFIHSIAFSQVVIKSYNEANITSKGLFGKNEKIAETIIPAIESGNKTTAPKANEIFKFAEPKIVDISPLNHASSELIGDSIIYRQKIIAQNATSITVSFDRLTLSKNAELYIYNPEGTVITGPITAKENINIGRFWSSNSFPGNSIILELKIPKNERSNNDLHIFKILFGFPVKNKSNLSDSTAFGHFNTSSSCNINVLCAQGNGFVNERKAVCLIETNDGGSGSGALVNNTCNVNKPYLLTAWHITNGRNPNNFTYIFGWWSSTCSPNTNNQQALLFNGATLRATYEPTDFSLLELFQTPASNSDLTFLGWSRSSSIPATSVGIHHPSGDQMKISFADNSASIGNVRLNSNTAWRVLWSRGIAQSGSSGSPLFDPNRRVIGQLYSITQPAGPPCNQQIGGTNYGRFDLSWTGGGTNDSRLSNWLDPTGSNVTTTNTTSVSNLVPANLQNVSLTGDNFICSGIKTYTLNGTTGNLPIIWSKSNNNIQISGSGSSITVTPSTGANGLVTLTATIGTASCQVNNVKLVTISVGPPVYGIITPYLNYCLGGSDWELGLQASSPNPTVTQYLWSRDGLPAGSGPTYYTYEFPPSCMTIGLKVGNSCGFSQEGTQVFCPPCGYLMSISPNPVKGQLNVTLDKSFLAKQNNSIEKVVFKLTKVDNAQFIRQWNFRNIQRLYSFNLAGIKKGVYTLEITIGKEKESKQIIIIE
jgi:hypothetical protein